MNNMQRNPFFLPSGFEPQEIINILEVRGDNEKRLDKIKERKRAERQVVKHFKHNKGVFHVNSFSLRNKRKPLKNYTENDHIQNGFDLAKKWGWDGINRPYMPIIMSVFGGSKRKHG